MPKANLLDSSSSSRWRRGSSSIYALSKIATTHLARPRLRSKPMLSQASSRGNPSRPSRSATSGREMAKNKSKPKLLRRPPMQPRSRITRGMKPRVAVASPRATVRRLRASKTAKNALRTPQGSRSLPRRALRRRPDRAATAVKASRRSPRTVPKREKILVQTLLRGLPLRVLIGPNQSNGLRKWRSSRPTSPLSNQARKGR